ncbi:MAG: HAMP domain-containing histidine kinase [Ruminococcaceae bacterium]|nr:HAMP domain-containing histidine kinase [Oscillospiraceae bacterium]
MKHIGTKLFIGFFSMAMLTVLILWIVQAGLMGDSNFKGKVNTVTNSLQQSTAADSTAYTALAEELNVSLIAIDTNNRMIFRSPGLPMMGMMGRNFLALNPSQADGTVHYLTAAGKSRYAMIGYPQGDDRFLFAVFSLADLDEAARILRQQLWIITLILVMTACLLALLLSRTLAKPIQAVTGAARDLAAGKFETRLPVKTKDEIGQLTTALNDLGVELGRTEKLRQELIANVSHELRAPLSVIKGYAETVRDVTWPDEQKRTAQLDVIVKESTRLTRVVKDILDYSRLRAGVEKLNIVEFPVSPVLEQLQRQYELEAARRGLTIKVKSPEQNIVFDPDRFAQVIHNLLSNAINHAYPDTEIELAVIDAGKKSRVEVTNHGKPIQPEEIKRIWERFYRSWRSDSVPSLGTGLGLAIVRSIFEQHAVRYGVISETERTTFWFETLTVIPESGGTQE